MRAFIAICSIITIAFGVGLAIPDASPAVTYIPADQVNAAFAKGAVLISSGNYMVHASRRDTEGQVEIHTRDADIIYLLEGTTTLITGGEIGDAKSTAPDEIRGTSVRGGDARKLSKGDVIVVPKGTPHWFKDVSGPVLYYVVKVR